MRATFPDAWRGGPNGPPFSRVVLVGGGHAHLELIRSAREFTYAGIELVLIDPGDFHYSGGASAVLGGSLTSNENRIDLADLCARFGVVRFRARAVFLDLPHGTVLCDDGRELPFHRLSLDIGSRCRDPGFDPPPGAVKVKPIAGVDAMHARLSAAAAHASQTVLVVGGGASAVELAGNLLRLATALPHPLSVTLVSSSHLLLAHAPRRAGRIALKNLQRRGAEIHLGDPVAGLADEGRVQLASGRMIAFNHLLLATGLEASTVVEGTPSANDAGYEVDATLSMPADRRVFAVGDCAAIAGHDLPKLGVYGVRAAPILKRNILASLEGRALKAYRPQAKALSILDLGDETGLALFGRLAVRSHVMLWWKRRIDRRFLDRYRPG